MTQEKKKNSANQPIEIGKIYKHYKGNLYKIIGFAKHSETYEDMIVYEALSDKKTWVRPKNMWNEMIDENTIRFTLLD